MLNRHDSSPHFSPSLPLALSGRRLRGAGRAGPSSSRMVTEHHRSNEVEGKKVDPKAPEGGLYAVKDGHLNQLTEDPTDTEPSFSADGRTIAFVRGGDIYAMRADGSGQRQLTSGPEVDSTAAGLPQRPATSSSSAAPPSARRRDLYTVSAQRRRAARARPPRPTTTTKRRFSPDGSTIVFVRSVAETGGGTADDSTRCGPSGAGLARLTRTGRIDEFAPRYFAGGIVFSRGESSEGPAPTPTSTRCARNGSKVKPQVAGAGSAYVEDVAADGRTLLFRRDQGLWVKRIGPARPASSAELPDESQTNAVFSSDGRKVAAFIAAEEASSRSRDRRRQPAAARARRRLRAYRKRRRHRRRSARSSPGSRCGARTPAGSGAKGPSPSERALRRSAAV